MTMLLDYARESSRSPGVRPSRSAFARRACSSSFDFPRAKPSSAYALTLCQLPYLSAYGSHPRRNSVSTSVKVLYS